MKPHPFRFAVLLCLSLANVAQADQRPLLIDDTKLTLVHKDFQLADGAGWDGRSTLYVPDVKGSKLLSFDLRKLNAPPKVRHEGARISGCCYQLGKLYISDNGNSQIATIGKTGPPVTLAKLDPKKRPNDLVVDVNGNVYVTITAEGVVRRVDPQGRVEVVIKDLVTPNGIALSPDGSTLYVSSAKEGTISQATITDGKQPWPATTFAQLDKKDDGFRGDGMCVDRAGNVYVTGAETVSVFNPSGKRIAEIKTPARPINAIIGGAAGRTLFISTFEGLYSLQLHAYGVLPNPPQTDLSDVPTSKLVNAIDQQLNVVYANISGRKLLMDVFNPVTTSGEPKPAVVLVHGGGWLKGDKTKFRSLALRLTKRGYFVAAIEYRLGFEAKFPAGIRDCNAATSFVRSNAGRWNINPDRITAVGGSAGGHLVGLMASGSNNEQLRHAQATHASCRLSAAVVMAGPLQITSGSVADKSHDLAMPSNAVNWLGGTIDSLPDLYALADATEKIDANTPPIFFISGSLDTPERNDLAREKLKALGIATKIKVHEDAKHGHWNRPDWIGQVVQDIDDMISSY